MLLQTAESQETKGLIEVQIRAELPGRAAEDAAAESRSQVVQALHFHRSGGDTRAGADGPASPPDRPAWKDELGQQPIDFRLPVSLIVAGEIGHVCKGLIQGWVVAPKLRKEFVAEAIAGIRRIVVG